MANGRFIKPRQPVDHFIAGRPFYRHQLPSVYQRPGRALFSKAKAARRPFIARRPFYRPRWPFIKAHGRFIERRQPVDHFIARRPFHRRFIKPRQPVDHFIKPVDHFIARRPFYRRFIKPRQPVDHFIARRPFYRRFIKPRQPVDHFIKPYFIAVLSSQGSPRRPFYQARRPFYLKKKFKDQGAPPL